MAQGLRRAIVSSGQSEIEIERSRFIGLAQGVRSEQEAQDRLAAIRARYPDATHHCYAWRAGDGQERLSDDGEPRATAGLPLLESLRRRDVDYGMVCVVRYFGGRKLGRPGLYRAYVAAGSAALEMARITDLLPGRRYRLRVGHGERVPLLRALAEAGAEILDQQFATDVLLEFWLPDSVAADFGRRHEVFSLAQPLGAEVRPATT